MSVSVMKWATAAAVTVGVIVASAGSAGAVAFPPPPPPPPPAPAFPSFPSFPSFPASPVTVTLSGDTLTVTGGAADDTVTIAPRDVVAEPTSKVRGGTTSVGLNLALLQQAAGLTLTGVDTAGRPAGAEFQVGFPIVPSSDFRYTPSSLVPVSGIIRHSGTITFNGSTTVGNFDIGFDPARTTTGRSGFFVASTTGLKAVLFDLGAPGSVSAALNRLAVGATPLLVSPEFASVLGNTALTGAVVGSARIDALSTPAAGRQIEVMVSPGFGQPFRTFTFPAAQVNNIVVSTGAGRNTVGAARVDLAGEFRVIGGANSDTVLISETIAGSLRLDTGGGSDAVNLSSDVVVTTAIDLGAGSDSVTVLGSLFTGRRAVQAGVGFDGASLFRTDLTRDALAGFESVAG